MKKRKFLKVASASTLAALAGLSLVACGSDDSNTYTVKLDSNDPDTSDSISVTTYDDMEVEEGSTINLPTLTYEGYTFGGWYSDVDFTNEFTSSDKVESDLTLYAKWTKNSSDSSDDSGDATTTYTITYSTEHGTAPASVSGATALPETLPSIEADGYTFGGWYLDQAFTTAATAGAAITANTTLYAKWTAVDTRTTYEKLSASDGVVLANDFTNFTSSDFVSSDNVGFTPGTDENTAINVTDGKLVSVDTSSNTAKLTANIGNLFEGVIEGTMKYTPTNTDNKLNGGWSIVQFRGYTASSLEDEQTLFALRTNNDKAIQVYFTSECGVGTDSKTTYNFKGTPFTYAANTEYEINWSYDFATYKLSISINGTAVVTDELVPEADRPVVFADLLFITAGSDTARGFKIDDFAVAQTIGTLDESIANYTASYDSIYNALDVTNNYTIYGSDLTNAYTTSKATIATSTSLDELKENFINGINALMSVTSDAKFALNKTAYLTMITAQKEERADDYTLNATAFATAYDTAITAINAAANMEVLLAAIETLDDTVDAIESDDDVRDAALEELLAYKGTTLAAVDAIDDIDDTTLATAKEEVDEVYAAQSNAISSCTAANIASTLASGKEALDAVVTKYEVTLEQYETNLTTAFATYKTITTSVGAVLTATSSLTPDFTGVTAKAGADEAYDAAKALFDNVLAFYNYIEEKKATCLAYVADADNFNTEYATELSALWSTGSAGILDGTYTLAQADALADTTIASIKADSEVTVTFVSDSETYATTTVAKNGTVTAPTTDPTLDGYSFKGWFTDANQTSAVDFTATISAATTYYAGWYDLYSVSGTSSIVFDSTYTTTPVNVTDTTGSIVVYSNNNADVWDGTYGGLKFNGATKNSRYIKITVSTATVVTLVGTGGGNKRYVELASTFGTASTTASDTVKELPKASVAASTTLTFNVPAGTWYLNGSGSLYITSISIPTEENIAISGITATATPGTDSITVSDVKLQPVSGTAFAITEGYTVTVKDSNNNIVSDYSQNLAAGTYTVTLKYGTYTSVTYEVTI